MPDEFTCGKAPAPARPLGPVPLRGVPRPAPARQPGLRHRDRLRRPDQRALASRRAVEPAAEPAPPPRPRRVRPGRRRPGAERRLAATQGLLDLPRPGRALPHLPPADARQLVDALAALRPGARPGAAGRGRLPRHGVCRAEGLPAAPRRHALLQDQPLLLAAALAPAAGESLRPAQASSSSRASSARSPTACPSRASPRPCGR
jgi:hypothetical protein